MNMVEFVDTVLEGLAMHMAVNAMDPGLMDLAMEDMSDPVQEIEFQQSLRGIDDVSGESIDPVLIQRAREGEMAGFRKPEVYTYAPRGEAKNDSAGKFIGVRWVDRDKGSAEHPDVRCRLVGQEFATSEKRHDLYAPTPPLAAARMLVSNCASRGLGGPGARRLCLIDVKKAFLYGKARRRIYVEFPEEDKRKPLVDCVGRLNKAMYGTRDAPVVWQEHLEAPLVELGFTACVPTPCVYYNATTDVLIVAHVDDMLCEGDGQILRELVKSLD